MGRALVIADADRVGAAKWAKEQFGINVFLLDDGFQHRRAKRDLDIVCIDGTDPFGGGKTLPFGRLREHPGNLSRASAIVITRAGCARDLDDLRATITKYAPVAQVFTADTKMSEMVILSHFLSAMNPSYDRDDVDLQNLAHKKAFAFCGIGNPEAFFDQLGRDNFELAGTKSFKDHFAYTRSSIDSVCAAAKTSGAGFLLTTAKDAVKLVGIEPELPCFVIKSEVIITDRNQFDALL
jgi:tetraacyldisaccharide 4'-kinase